MLISIIGQFWRDDKINIFSTKMIPPMKFYRITERSQEMYKRLEESLGFSTVTIFENRHLVLIAREQSADILLVR